MRTHLFILSAAFSALLACGDGGTDQADSAVQWSSPTLAADASAGGLDAGGATSTDLINALADGGFGQFLNADGGVDVAAVCATFSQLPFCANDGGLELPDGGARRPDGGFTRPDGGFTRPDGGPGRRDGGASGGNGRDGG